MDQITVQDLKALWERVQGGETVSEAVVAIEEKFVRMSAFVRGSPAKVKAHAVDELSASIIEAGAVKTSGMPVPVYGDGNCLFRSVAFSMLGSELPWCELRVRTALEIELNADVYARQVLRRCVDTVPQFSPVNFIPQLLSKEAELKLYEARTVVGLSLEEALTCVFRDVVSKECLCSGIFSSMHHLMALSCVIGCKINVLYPSFNPGLAPFFNTTLYPMNTMRNIIDDIDNVSHGIHDLPSITIMWTNTVKDKPCERSGFWQPNHFVPVVDSHESVQHLDGNSDDLTTAVFKYARMTNMTRKRSGRFYSPSHGLSSIGSVSSIETSSPAKRLRRVRSEESLFSSSSTTSCSSSISSCSNSGITSNSSRENSGCINSSRSSSITSSCSSSSSSSSSSINSYRSSMSSSTSSMTKDSPDSDGLDQSTLVPSINSSGTPVLDWDSCLCYVVSINKCVFYSMPSPSASVSSMLCRLYQQV